MPASKKTETVSKKKTEKSEKKNPIKSPKVYNFKPSTERIYRKVLGGNNVTFTTDGTSILNEETEGFLKAVLNKIPVAVYGSRSKFDSLKGLHEKKTKKIKPKHIEKCITFLDLSKLPNESAIKKRMIEAGKAAVIKFRASKAGESLVDEKKEKTRKKTDTSAPSKKRKQSESVQDETSIQQTQTDLNSSMEDL